MRHNRTLSLRPLAGLAMIVAGWCMLTTPLRATPIDEQLKPLAPKILAHCREHGWKNVGVLPFRVIRGKAKAQWHVGQLNSIMALRLENALIVFNDPDNLVGVTRHASTAAGKQFGAIDYLTAANRKKLLTGQYPLAWGKKQVQVDAFLTGTVHIAEDFKTTKVSLSVFDRKDTDLRPLVVQNPVQFTVTTDRATLADMQNNFFLASREPLRTDKFDAGQFLALLKKERAGFDEFLDFQVYYNDKPAAMERKGNAYRVPSPKPNDKVHFTLTAKKEPLGVVLLVNGINTFRKETLRLPEQYSKWILQKPKKTYFIRGFYPTPTKVERFKVLPDQESMFYPLADGTRRGKIDIHIFRQGEKPQQKPKTLTSLRTDNGVAESFKEAHKQILFGTPAGQKGLILPDPNTGQSRIDLVDFSNPVHVGSVTITYYKNASSKGNGG